MNPSFQPSNSSSSSLNSFSPEKTMELVWQDIDLASLEDHSNKENNTSFPCMILQDFLATPARNHHSSAPQAAAVSDDHMDSRPATMLSLYSGSGFSYFSSESALQNSRALTVFPSSSGGGGFVSPAAAVSIVKKRPQQYEDNSASGDRRQKRMIKNRASAARSRARKQAYAHELEIEVAQLREENARLKDKVRSMTSDFQFILDAIMTSSNLELQLG